MVIPSLPSLDPSISLPDLDRSLMTRVAVGLAVPIPLALLSTALRLFAELYQHRNRLAADDFLMIWETIIAVSSCALGLHSVQRNTGRDSLTKEQTESALLTYYIFFHFYFFANASTKLSVLALYYRAFPSVTFRKVVACAAIIVLAWLVTFDTTWGLVCRPIRIYWDVETQGTCIDSYRESLASCITNFLLNFWIFTLPIPLILRMRIPRDKKLSLSCLFSVGLTTCVIGAIRIAITAQLGKTSFTERTAALLILSAWEPIGGILCANIPIIYKPLVSGYRRLLLISPRASERSASRTNNSDPKSWYYRHVAARRVRAGEQRRGTDLELEDTWQMERSAQSQAPGSLSALEPVVGDKKVPISELSESGPALGNR